MSPKSAALRGGAALPVAAVGPRVRALEIDQDGEAALLGELDAAVERAQVAGLPGSLARVLDRRPVGVDAHAGQTSVGELVGHRGPLGVGVVRRLPGTVERHANGLCSCRWRWLRR